MLARVFRELPGYLGRRDVLNAAWRFILIEYSASDIFAFKTQQRNSNANATELRPLGAILTPVIAADVELQVCEMPS